MQSTPDSQFMERAIALAKLGGGWVDPNPQVGCVIARDGSVIGEGYHHEFGRPHAERDALSDCIARGESAKDADVYVTLEPCAHTGKTPPCADALIEAGVRRVIIGSSDPNPLVAGRGIEKLQSAGIDVVVGFMKSECDALNEPFFYYIRNGRPLVIAKYAMTLDGMTATRTGKSRWITSDAARERVHRDRSRYAAIMVGVGTVIADDPMLNVRHIEQDASRDPHQPIRIVIDTDLRTPLGCQLVQTASEQRTIIVTCQDDASVHIPYLEAGCELINVGRDVQDHVDLHDAMDELGRRGIDSVILEGGRTLMSAAFEAGIIDKVQVYIAPKLFADVDEPSDATIVNDITITNIGPDILIEGNLDE